MHEHFEKLKLNEVKDGVWGIRMVSVAETSNTKVFQAESDSPVLSTFKNFLSSRSQQKEASTSWKESRPSSRHRKWCQYFLCGDASLQEVCGSWFGCERHPFGKRPPFPNKHISIHIYRKELDNNGWATAESRRRKKQALPELLLQGNPFNCVRLQLRDLRDPVWVMWRFKSMTVSR